MFFLQREPTQTVLRPKPTDAPYPTPFPQPL